MRSCLIILLLLFSSNTVLANDNIWKLKEVCTDPTFVIFNGEKYSLHDAFIRVGKDYMNQMFNFKNSLHGNSYSNERCTLCYFIYDENLAILKYGTTCGPTARGEFTRPWYQVYKTLYEYKVLAMHTNRLDGVLYETNMNILGYLNEEPMSLNKAYSLERIYGMVKYDYNTSKYKDSHILKQKEIIEKFNSKNIDTSNIQNFKKTSSTWSEYQSRIWNYSKKFPKVVIAMAKMRDKNKF